jgi:hypothetical protein
MVQTIVINNTHLVSGTLNKFSYKFPTTYVAKAGDKVGVVSLTVFNCTFNVKASLGNNQITLNLPWCSKTATLTLADGYYSVTDLNNALQAFQITLGWYYVGTTSTASSMYFFELQENAVQYSVQLNCYCWYTLATLPSGYAYPTTGTQPLTGLYPSSTTSGNVTFNTAFGSLLGFTAGTYPSAPTSVLSQQLSNTIPILSPVNSYVLCCNLVNSPLSQPNNVIYSLPLDVAFGQLCIAKIGTVIWNNIVSSAFNTLEITFLDQALNQLELRDSEITLLLSIKSASEND